MGCSNDQGGCGCEQTGISPILHILSIPSLSLPPFWVRPHRVTLHCRMLSSTGRSAWTVTNGEEEAYTYCRETQRGLDLEGRVSHSLTGAPRYLMMSKSDAKCWHHQFILE